MEVVPSMWLSSLTSALLFFSGGRLWGRAAEVRRLAALAEQREREAADLRREVEELRRKVRDLEPASSGARERSISPAPLCQRPTSDHKLETAITEHLDALRAHDGSFRTAVLSDMRGLLVASSGDVRHDEALAAAAALTSDAAHRVRKLAHLGELMEIRLVDADDTVFTARWLRGEHEGLLLSTVGSTAARADPDADAIRTSLSHLIGWT